MVFGDCTDSVSLHVGAVFSVSSVEEYVESSITASNGIERTDSAFIF